MESNTLVGNAAIKQHQKEILMNTKGQYMKELDSRAGIVLNNTLLGQILKSTKEIYIYKSPARQEVCPLNVYFNIEYIEKLG